MGKIQYDFSGKTVVVTGASKGIGQAVTAAFLKAGAFVVAASRGEAVPEHAHHRLLMTKADVSSETDVAKLVELAVEKTGRLDVFVNNAGIIESPAPLTEQDTDTLERVLATNVRGVFLGIKYAGRVMKRQKAGVIVNISSIAGKTGVPNLGIYAASKFAVAGLTRSAALEFAPLGVRVVSTLPHATETPMMEAFVGHGETEGRHAIRGSVPLGRMAEAQEQANAVLFLAAAESAFVTGVELPVDGGRLA